jgi:hypothetical protein
MAPMEKSYYLITWQPAFLQLLQSLGHESVREFPDPPLEQVLVAITQGGFGQDTNKELWQVKARFLEFVCQDYDLELSRSAETFDQYFLITEPDLFIDLDEEV